MIRQC